MSALFISAFAALGAGETRLVDVFTGTSNSRWMLFPGTTLPFGLVKLSPDNQANVWNGGYEYTVSSISGFSHLHAMALSGLSIMPMTGNLHPEDRIYRVFPGSPDGPFGTMWTAGYRSRIDKASEKGAVGYYAVNLHDYDIKAEVTSTTRCGFLRLTYPETDQAHLLMDFAFPAEEANEIEEVQVVRESPTELSGYIKQSNQYAPDYTVYFTLQLNRPADSMDAWTRQEPKKGNYGDWGTPVSYQKDVKLFRAKGRCGVLLNFQTSAGEVVQVRTGVSLVSAEGARLNFDREMTPIGWNFDAVVKQAVEAWSRIFDRVAVTGGTVNEQRMFYTCLYRSFAAKSVINDVDGTYLDACHRVHKPQNGSITAMYSSDGLWGAQWNLFPLWTLLTPKLASSWIKFDLQAAENGGWIPEAPVLGGYAPIMGAQHQNALIVSAYQKGIRDFDARNALQHIRHDLTTQGEPYLCGGYVGNRQLKEYEQYGYVPDEAGAASNTMEYAYDDWVAGQMALALGDEATHAYFSKRALNYKNQIDPETHYTRRRRRDGTWVSPFDMLHFGTQGGWNGAGFMEGTPWIYSWYAPHDLRGLIKIIGREEFNRRLEEGFAKRYVDLGNEPNLEAPFLLQLFRKALAYPKVFAPSLTRYVQHLAAIGVGRRRR